MSHTAIKAAWAAQLDRMGNAGRAHRKALVMRCHEAMGPERALLLAKLVQLGDQRRSPSQSLKLAIKWHRKNDIKYPWIRNPERVRECLAALLWVKQIARRDREFFSKREAV
jgi:hypothetical protein